MEIRVEKKLQSEVAEKYQVLKGHGIGEYHWNGHVVHLDRLKIIRADYLVKKGFPYLVEKPRANGKKNAADNQPSE